jgi:YHS domain-containing protein
MDAFDGASDKTVTKCPACQMKMDGSKEHALPVSGYTLHFCSAHCKKAWEKEPAKSILALKIP